MPFRILHCIHSVNPAGGGPIEGIKQLSAANQRHGHLIEIASLDDPGAEWVKESPLKVHALGPGRLSYGYSARLRPWLEANHANYDIVVVNGIWQYNAFGVWRALRGTATPYVVYTHGMLDPWFKRNYPLKHLKKWLYWPWGDYRVLRDAAAVLFTCEEERRLARDSFWLYRARERVVKYGTLGPPSVDCDMLRRRFGERWPATVGKRCILHLGRVHEKKGADLVLTAFAEHRRGLTAREAENWHLIMAGPAEHPYGRAMRSLATKLGLDPDVTWTGMLVGEAKWAAYFQSEVFLLPSHQENFGIVVAESLACGRPVLISDKVNIWREIERHQAALVDTDDFSGTLRLLRRWGALGGDARSEMGRRARDCFKTEFHVERAAEALVEAVSEFMPAAATPGRFNAAKRR